MAIASGMPPMLRSRRSSQSGLKAMGAAYTVIYTENTLTSESAYIFMGAEINLTPMLAADVIDVRIRKIIIRGGAWANHDEKSFSDAQPTGHPSFRIAAIPDVYGVEISMRQTAGVLRSIECEFFDAKRLGLV